MPFRSDNGVPCIIGFGKVYISLNNANHATFDKKGLEQAGYNENPLEDGSLDEFQLHSVDMTKLTRTAVEGLGLSQKEVQDKLIILIIVNYNYK